MANPYINTPAMTDASIASTNPEIIVLERRKKMAELLAAQGAEGQPQGQMVSGYYVAPSWAQRLNPVLSGIIGQSQLRDIESEQSALAEALRKKEGEDLANFYKNLYGQAGTADVIPQGQTLRDDEGNLTYGAQAGTAAVPANPQAAFEIATKTSSPLVRAQLAEMLKGQKVGEGEKVYSYNPMTGKREVVAEGGEKFQRPIEVNTGNGTQLLDARTLKPMGFVPKVKEAGADVNPQEAPLRTQFLGQIQPHIQMSQAYSKITSAPDTAAGDMSKIFGFMKILDPGSTVREGEYASAEQTRGIPDNVVAAYNRAVTGKRLTTEQREKFDQAAGDLISSQKKQFDQQKQFFTNVAVSARANPANVIFDPYQGLDIKTTPAKPAAPSAAKQLNIPSTNLFNAADAIISGKK